MIDSFVGFVDSFSGFSNGKFIGYLWYCPLANGDSSENKQIKN